MARWEAGRSVLQVDAKFVHCLMYAVTSAKLHYLVSSRAYERKFEKYGVITV